MSEGKKGTFSKILALAGAVVLTLGIVADFIGIGSGPMYGPSQLMVIVAGFLMIIIGLKGCNCNKNK